MFNRMLALSLVAFAIFVFAAPKASAMFPDVPPDHWAYDAVDYLEQEGFVVGFPDGNYYGDENLSRYEFAMVISRIYSQFIDKIENENYEPPVDVESILDRLIEEFSSEIDELWAMVDENSARIDSLDETVGGYDDQFEAISNAFDEMDRRLHPYGDLTIWFNGNYPDGGMQTQRPQFELNFGFTSRITDEMTLGARVASAPDGATQSKWVTFDEAFSVKPFQVDRAYLMYQPESAPGFTLWAGKFAPPWRHTFMTWESDLQPEGLAQHYNHDNFDFYLAELVPAEEGFYLVAQVGYSDLLVDNLDVAITYHFINEDAWNHILADMISGDIYSGGFDPSRLESPTDYRAFEMLVSYSNEIANVPFEIVGNCLMNLEETAPGLPDEAGWQQAAYAKLTLWDKPVEPGDWNVYGEWGRLQPNSVLPWTTEAWRGRGDVEYWVVGWNYRLMRNTDFWIAYINREVLSTNAESDGLLVTISTYFK
ncbi:MAG TPA: putative porin [bacterium]|jgi:hypothetical protein